MIVGEMNSTEKVVNIAQDFSRTPGGRYRTDGPASGEEFREEFLVPAMGRDAVLVVELDGARGYPSSFLEEAFGGLVRQFHLTRQEFTRKIHIKSSSAYEIYVSDILTYVEQAANA